jgi:phage shock protein PspC (stress-responsive transcriptional regulator)
VTRPQTDAVPARPPLRRPRADRLLLGVCAGVARSLELPPLGVRLAAVALAAVALPLVAAGYVIVAAIVPRDDGRVLLGGVPADRRETLVGWALIAGVLIWFVDAEFRLEELVWPGLSSFGIFAAAVAALGLLALNQRRAAMAAPAAPVAASPAAAASPTPSAASPGRDTADAPGPSAAADTAATADASRPFATGDTAATAAFADAPTATQPLPPPPPPRPRGISLGTIGAAVLLIGAAIAFLLDAVDAIDPDATAVAAALAVGAVAAGAGAIAGAVLQRRGVLVLLALGALLAATGAGVGLVSDELDEGVGFRTERPATAADIPATYVLGVGDLDVDLRDTLLPAGVTTVRARVRVGELTVIVPRGVRVESIGPTQVDGVARVNAALPQPKPAKSKRQRRERRRAAAEQKTIRIDADVREGDANVVARGP